MPGARGLGEERLRRFELCLVGTLRRTGWPRISPCEPEFVDGDLMLGMMWRLAEGTRTSSGSPLHGPQLRHRPRGRRGRLQALRTRGRRARAERPERYRQTVHARIGWAPDEPEYHLFAIDVDSAGFVVFGRERYGLAWGPRPGHVVAGG
jgi:hypothetical protein